MSEQTPINDDGTTTVAVKQSFQLDMSNPQHRVGVIAVSIFAVIAVVAGYLLYTSHKKAERDRLETNCALAWIDLGISPMVAQLKAESTESLEQLRYCGQLGGYG